MDLTLSMDVDSDIDQSFILDDSKDLFDLDESIERVFADIYSIHNKNTATQGGDSLSSFQN